MSNTVARAALVGAILQFVPPGAAAQDGQVTVGRLPSDPSGFVLTLAGQRFDPVQWVPEPAPALRVAPAGQADLRLVQLTGPPRPEWINGLRAEGLEVVQYIHPYTYIVWGHESQLARARRHAAVRWGGEFQPAYRLPAGPRTYSATPAPVRVLVARAAGTDAVVRAIESLGVKVTDRRVLDARLELAACEVAGRQLESVACVPGVYSVQPVPTDGGLRGEMSAQVCADNVDVTNLAQPGYLAWLTALGLSGAGVVIANVDSGVWDTHADLAARMLPCTGVTCGGEASSQHGTHTAGLAVADGSTGALDSFGFLRGLGVAPGAHLVEQVYYPHYLGVDGMRLLMAESYLNGALLSSNSWGPSGSPRGYDADTLQVDLSVRDADPNTPGNQYFTYVLSIMNGHGGTSTQGTPDEAKNIITVGATQMQAGGGEQLLTIDDLDTVTAHGPCLDGRLIPHVVAPGCLVDSTQPWQDGHGLMCGTSMASPHVSGAVALFVEYYRSLAEYEEDPSPALIKAALLPVAHDLAGHLDANGGVLGHPFDSKQGWGRLNIAALVDPDVCVRYFDEPLLFTASGQEWTWDATAGDPRRPMKLMLAWTDAPGHGLGGSTPAWNNNLDLIVQDGGALYRGNHFGSNGWSATGGVADECNNTEGVFIGPTAPGTYQVRVVAENINSDGVPNVGGPLDQDFALVCYNCAPEDRFALSIPPQTVELCATGTATTTVDVVPIGEFAAPVTLCPFDLPPGLTADFDPNPVLPGQTSTLTITTAGAVAGFQALSVIGESGPLARLATVNVRVVGQPPTAVVLSSPAPGAVNVPLRPALTWLPALTEATYEVQVARDAGFAEPVATATGLTGTTFTPAANLDQGAVYFWRVRATNVCGVGSFSAVLSFTTRHVPVILLVDDDNNAPDVRPYYANALATLGRACDVWETGGTDAEPTSVDLEPYETVIWFTGAATGGSVGPGLAGQAALEAFLATGRNLFLCSQDYYAARGLTELMEDELGVASITGEVLHTNVSGQGSVFGGLGPYALSYPAVNRSDRLEPDATAETAFSGSAGSAAVNKDDSLYRTTYWGFPFEALVDSAAQAAVLGALLDWFRPFVDCNANGLADHADLSYGTSTDENENGVPDECEEPPACRGDANCDGVVSLDDIKYFVTALSGRAAWVAYHVERQGVPPTCWFANCDVNNRDGVTFDDIRPFVQRLGTTCP